MGPGSAVPFPLVFHSGLCTPGRARLEAATRIQHALGNSLRWTLPGMQLCDAGRVYLQAEFSCMKDAWNVGAQSRLKWQGNGDQACQHKGSWPEQSLL